jgi:glycosyltransferase involved in cell wall biosynthesis
VALLINLLSWLPGHSGFGSYVQRVVPGLPGLRLQLDAAGQGVLHPAGPWSAEAPPVAPARWMRLLQAHALAQHGLSLPRVLAAHGLRPAQLQAVYSPLFDALLALPRVPQLITCHDLTPLVLPNSRKAWLRYRLWQPLHLRCATRVVAISHTVADQLLRFGVPAARITVIPNGIRVEHPCLAGAASDDLLVLARHEVNKNLPALLRALAGVQRRLPAWRGVVRIVGRSGRQTPQLLRLHRALPRPEQVLLIPALSEVELRSHLRTSLALVSASLEEGFDYPVLEAKAEGLPTLLSDIPVHREFHQDSSWFFPVDDDGAVLASHLQTLLGDRLAWRQLSQAGYALAQQLTLERQQAQIAEQIACISAR